MSWKVMAEGEQWTWLVCWLCLGRSLVQQCASQPRSAPPAEHSHLTQRPLGMTLGVGSAQRP